MAKYFTVGGGNDDATLLPPRHRDAQGLAELADQVEYDIIAHFTKSSFNDPIWATQHSLQGDVVWSGPYTGAVKIGDSLFVMLRGYAVDAANADPQFKEAMRREIASVLAWRIPLDRREPGVVSDGDGDRSMSFRENAESQFPSHFPKYLGLFAVNQVYTL